MTKFVHIRHVTWDGDLNPKGGITVAYNFDPETRTATYYAARCRDHDHYNKKIGRAISSGRLAKRGGTSFTVAEGNLVANAVVSHLLCGPDGE